jgi:hypothetical protein
LHLRSALTRAVFDRAQHFPALPLPLRRTTRPRKTLLPSGPVPARTQSRR